MMVEHEMASGLFQRFRAAGPHVLIQSTTVIDARDQCCTSICRRHFLFYRFFMFVENTNLIIPSHAGSALTWLCANTNQRHGAYEQALDQNEPKSNAVLMLHMLMSALRVLIFTYTLAINKLTCCRMPEIDGGALRTNLMLNQSLRSDTVQCSQLVHILSSR